MTLWTVSHSPHSREREVKIVESAYRHLDKTALPKFKQWKLKRSVPQMFRRRGGRLADGTTERWVSNSMWTVRAKGGDMPLFSRPGKSGLIKGMDVFIRTRGQRSNRIVHDVTLTNDRPYSAELHRGFNSFRVTVRRAKALRIPIGGGEFVFAKSARVGRQRGGTPGRKHVVWLKSDQDQLEKMIRHELREAGSRSG